MKLGEYIPSFIFLYVVSIIIFMIGAWDQASYYNLEPPLVALVVGMIISNVIGLPRWMDTGFRVEYYIKTGIVLLGATLPFTLIVWAGPVTLFQAAVVSIVTFLVIDVLDDVSNREQAVHHACRRRGLRRFRRHR